MNTLFVSKCGDILSIAQRVEGEGHNSYLYVEDKLAKKVGDGMVNKPHFSSPLQTELGKVVKGNVITLLKEVQPDLVVFDMVGMGEVADYIKTQKVPVVGGCKWADFAELNREYGYKLMRSVGIKTPITHVFTKEERKQAVELVKGSKKRYVYKPDGNITCAHTYVSKGWEDMVGMLQLWEGDECDFELQEWVDGVEVSCELWWNGVSGSMHNVTFEEKYLMDGQVGPMVGCMGSVVQFVSDRCGLVRDGVGKVERLLKKTNYKGPIDLNSIVTKEGVYGLEWTVRFGYDAIQPLLELYRGSITTLLWDMVSGKNCDGGKGLAMSVRMSIPPYPCVGVKGEKGVPLMGTSKESLKHIWWNDVYLKEGVYVSGGVDGNLGCATAKGEDVRECTRRTYRTIHNLTIPQLQYRTDVGERVVGDSTKLREWGYL